MNSLRQQETRQYAEEVGLTESEAQTLQTMVNRLNQWLFLASHDEKEQATNWYNRAHNTAVVLSKRYGCTVDQVAAIISVLSPGVAWEQNLLDAENVLKAWIAGDYWTTVGTYGPQQGKAWTILRECDQLHGAELDEYVGTENARKTRAFYHDILSPKESQAVTIDRWILRALGVPVQRTTAQLYRLGTLAMQFIAQQKNARPHQVQALVWVCIRNRDGLPQTAFNLSGF